MILDELTNYYPLDPKAVETAKSFLVKNPLHDDNNDDDRAEAMLFQKFKAAGWTERKGEGYYSSVFAKPGENFVLKVNKRKDRAFLWFAFIARKFPNQHFPKIGNAKVITVQTKEGLRKYYIYAVEILEHLPKHNMIDKKIAAFCRGIAQGSEPNSTLEQEMNELRPEYGKQYPSLRQACEILKKYREYHAIDLHANNVMQRKDGTIVLADPYSRV